MTWRGTVNASRENNGPANTGLTFRGGYEFGWNLEVLSIVRRVISTETPQQMRATIQKPWPNVSKQISFPWCSWGDGLYQGKSAGVFESGRTFFLQAKENR